MLESSQDEWERLATNLRVEKALLEVLDLLADFPVVVFKGGLLTRLIYGDLRKRASADNDLWIEEPACSRVLQRLLGAGFRPLSGIDPDAALRRYGQVALWPRGDLGEVSLDLHAQPFMGELFSVKNEDLRAHLIEVPLHDRTVLTFDKPLSLVHMVAHYLQHRLERDHLEEIGAAWDRWQLDEDELRVLARHTCTEPALEHALLLCAELGHCQKRPLAVKTRRARLCGHLDSPRRSQLPPTRGRIASYLLAAPQRLPRAAFSGVFLESDDLVSRYGKGSRVSQTWRRARELLVRG